METLSKLKKAKTSLKGSIRRIQTFVDGLSEDGPNITPYLLLEVKLKKVEQLQAKVEELKVQSFNLENDDEQALKEFEDDIESCESRLEDLEVSLKLLINPNKKESVSKHVDQNNSIESITNNIKIPPIILPIFSGKYEQFSSFKTQFDDLITSNNLLSDSQKLYYLNSCLSNEVKEFASTYDTFSSLYEALYTRYDNKRLIVDVHVNAILNFKNMERESATEIRTMIDCIQKNLRALKQLKFERNELFDIFLQNIMLNKLDKETRKNFELMQKTKEVPTLEQFISFLEQRETVLLSVHRNCYSETKAIKKTSSFAQKSKTVLINEKTELKKCIVCDKEHPIFRCSTFLGLTPQKRFELVKMHKLCEVCLKKGHKKSDCRSLYKCICGQRHSNAICFRQNVLEKKKQMTSENQSSDSALDESENKTENKSSTMEINSLHNAVLSNTSSDTRKNVLLSTGNILLQKRDGSLITCRVIFDSASNVNILSRKMSELLGNKLEKVQTSVVGINSSKQNLRGKLRTFVSNKSGSFKEPIEFLVADKITGLTPSVRLDVSKLKIPHFLELADPKFFEAKEVHALLNADIFFRIIKDNVYKVNEDLLFRETDFGWIASGRLDVKAIDCDIDNSCLLLKNGDSIDDTLKQFFELESLGIKDDPCLRDEDQAMQIFEETVKFKDGRYEIELPFRKDWKSLSNNTSVAEQRFRRQDTVEDAFIISQQAKQIMADAGMNMRKWISNDPTLMQRWSEENFDTYPVDVPIDVGANNAKVLGITWQTEEDCFTLDTKSILDFVSNSQNTKRFLLQTIGKIFDPIGLLTPFTMRMKCLMQKLWEKKMSWDEDLPPSIMQIWKSWCKELPLLGELKIPRLVLDSNSKDDIVEVHVFCDSSQLAYGATVYVKLIKQDSVSVNLVTSKSRVAPLKGVTLPRLELLGALVAARLSSKVVEIVSQKRPCTVFHWTDSKVVLFWIKGSTKNWKQFVANRVREINNLTDPDSWFHCAGKDNPADLLTRGLSVDSLLHSEKWWKGPSFLALDKPVGESDTPIPNEEEYLPELKCKDSIETTVLTLSHDKTFFDNLINRSNNFLTLVRICSYLFRFINNSKHPERKISGPLGLEELAKSEKFLIKSLQEQEFSKELTALKSGGIISNRSKIINLSPILDKDGILRVGGRLENSQLTFSSKHPILLPSKSKLTEIIVTYYHIKYLHVGAQHLLFQVRQKYWPIHGRNLCKRIVHHCVICFKADPKEYHQKMGNLPKQRITPDKVFNSTGLDLCGPFFIKNKYQRKGPEIKIYVCLFICLVTKAIHLEMISDLTSQALIATLKRFIARRGKCQKIYSDNGTNMVGANRELNRLFKLVADRDETLFAFFGEEKIEWSFIPPRSPNFAGIWEANIKAFKFHFKRVACNAKFTYEEFLTLLTQIEAILNSRPLLPLTSDVEDLEVLTPAHFLIGRPITAIVEPTLTDVETNRLNAWQKITRSVQTIWKRWSLSYLNSLQQRSKWVNKQPNLKIGDMVLIREENLPPCKWAMGRIVALYPGQDQIVRVVDIKTCKGIYKRAVSRLSLLPVD